METLKTNKGPLIFMVIILLLMLGLGRMTTLRNEANESLAQEIKLRNALQSEMVVTRDELGRETAEKLTIQTDLKTLEAMKDKLSAEKRQLIELVKTQDKNSKLIAAALVKTQVEVREIVSNKPVAITDSTATFAVATDSISYDAQVKGVRVDTTTQTPSLVVRNLKIPNDAQISFQWGEKKEGYPVSFKITNSNPLFKTKNIESYAIPELKKEEVRPTFFQGLGITLKNGKTPFVIGLGAGAAGVLLLTGALR